MKIDPEIEGDVTPEEIEKLDWIDDRFIDHRRSARLLVIKGPGGDCYENGETRYGGKPFMEKDTAWPEYNGEKMIFVAQINSLDIPTARLRGILLFFVAPGAYEEGEASVAILTNDYNGASLRDDGPFAPFLRLKVPYGSDYPHSEDLELIDKELYQAMIDVPEGIIRSEIVGAEIDNATGLEVTTFEIVKHHLTARNPNFSVDKLGGWPCWSQASETPKNTDGSDMIFIGQLSSMGRCSEIGAHAYENPVWGSHYIFVASDMKSLTVVQQS